MKLELGAADRRSFKLLAWAALPVLVLAAVVQTTGVGIDLLVVAAAGLGLFALERSVGDWLGEWLGPLAAAAIFVAFGLALSWYFLSSALGRPQTDRFFLEAERRGYRTAYYQAARSPDVPPPAQPSGPDEATAATSGSRIPGASSAQPAADSTARSEPPPQGEADAPVPSAARPDEGITRSARSIFRRLAPGDPIATDLAVSVSPPTLEVARRAVISATVTSAGAPVKWGTVEFTVNGMGAGRVEVNSEGIATTTFQTHIPGSYEVRARYAGASDYATSTARATLNVVARR